LIISRNITVKKLFSKNTELFLRSIRSNMMNDTFGISHSALSGLDGFSFSLHAGLHPVLTDSALAGLTEILISALNQINWILLFHPET
jgi:hypothetical protein